MSKLKGMFIFSVGAAIGSVVTWKLLKTKYEQEAQEAIEETREYYRSKTKTKSEKKVAAVTKESGTAPEAKKNVYTNYKNLVTDLGYSGNKTDKENGDCMAKVKPYVISPDDFGERDYTIVSLTYYSDGVVADDADQVIENVDEIIGLESLDSFGEYEDDSVFVRNEELATDFEILLDERNYTDINPDYRG